MREKPPAPILGRGAFLLADLERERLGVGVGKGVFGGEGADHAKDVKTGRVVAARRDAHEFNGDFVAGAGDAVASEVKIGDVNGAAEGWQRAKFLETGAFVNVGSGKHGHGPFESDGVGVGRAEGA